MTDSCEVLVVGAGPAGTTAAQILAAAGKSVILLEKEKLPRHKPCGGGVPARTGVLLPPGFPAAGEVAQVILQGAYTGRQTYAVPEGKRCQVVERAQFDHFLAQKAVAAGAALRENCALKTLEKTGDYFSVETTQGQVTAKKICVCDGVFSPTARALGFEKNAYGFCLEGLAKSGADNKTAVFDLAAVRKGYAWSFPRGEYCAVGIGGAFAKNIKLEKYLASFLRRTPEARGLPLENVFGGMLPDYAGGKKVYARDGAFLLGDAGGLVDPLTGEGIFYAVKSAALAAEAILSGGGEKQYEESLRGEILPELDLALRYAKIFRRTPGVLLKFVMCLPRFKRYANYFVEILSGTMNYRQMGERIRQWRKAGCGVVVEGHE
jgi:geranylgeranyl reductase family protein